MAAGVLAIGDLFVGGPPELVLGIAVGGFALVQSASYLVVLARRGPRSGGDGRTATGRGRLPARRVGALLSHAGIAIVALVVVVAGVGRQEASATLSEGQAFELGAYRVQFAGNTRETIADRSIVLADVQIEGPGIDQAAAPSLSLVGNSTQAVATPAIVSGPTTDVYLVLLNVDPVAGTVSLRLTIQPFMSWLWAGGLLVALGGLVALGPRLTRRSASAPSREPEGRPAEAVT